MGGWAAEEEVVVGKWRRWGCEEETGGGIIFIHCGSATQKFTFPSSTLSLALQVQQDV